MRISRDSSVFAAVMPAGMILALWLCQIGDSSRRLVHSSTTSLHQFQQRCCYFDERDVLVIDHPRLSTSRLSRRALVVLVAFAAHVMRLTRVVYRASCIVKLAWASCVLHRAHYFSCVCKKSTREQLWVAMRTLAHVHLLSRILDKIKGRNDDDDMMMVGS